MICEPTCAKRNREKQTHKHLLRYTYEVVSMHKAYLLQMTGLDVEINQDDINRGGDTRNLDLQACRQLPQ